ncbi:MAG: HAMP domain-containing protein [Nitrospiraceae bacterium]|nr:MAG: HAMP domain-containing protein [Nitrospiraceae bacterium]
MKLRTRITLLTTVMAVSVVFFTLLAIRGVIISAFREELEKRAVSIAGNLSDRVADHVIRKDYFQATNDLTEVLGKENDVEYIFVTDEEGNLIAHTFKNEIPPDILTWNPLHDITKNIQLLDTEKGYIRDVGIKIFAGTHAELHLGIREDDLKQTIAEVRKITVPIILLVTLLGVIVSFIFSRLLTEPLNKFVEFTKVLGRGEFGKRVDVPYGDELGYLARNFNRLSMELKRVSEKMEEAYTYTHLLEAEKLSTIGQISSGLAHELKNPMTTLKMLFQAFKDQPDMTKEDAEIISREIEKIDTIITRFTGFIKQKSFQASDTNIHSLIERVLTLASFDIRNSGITVQQDMIDTLPTIKADRALLEHVFLNLILNAVQAMPDGGEIRISGKTDDRFVEVMIWDKGSGISPDIRSKVFEPFFTTKENGTGLGLSIVYNIVKSHGGKIFFHSNEGAGTVFTVKLPVGET